MSKTKAQKDLNVRTLIDLGLNENEAVLYFLLLGNIRMTVEEMSLKSPFQRTMIYHILKQLENKSLIKSKKDNWKTIYSIENPEKLYTLLEQKEAEFQKQKESIKKLIPNLKQKYNLKNKKTETKTYEGIFEYQKILQNIIIENPKEIFSYENLKENKPGIEIRGEFENKRIYRKIKKNVLFFEDKESLETLSKIKYNDYTNFKSLNQKNASLFATDFIIYNNKVVYISYFQNEPTAVEIEDEHLANMQKSIFLKLWSEGKNKTLYYTEVNK